MKIAGLQKLSLVDYPGLLAAIVFVQGCNFHCGYCQNPDLVTAEKQFDCSGKEVLDYLSRRKGMIEGVVVTWGEPEIHAGLTDFIKRLKAKEVKVKLDTNGSNPKQLNELLLAGLLDYVALDIKTSFPKYNLVTDLENVTGLVSESIHGVMRSSIPYEFRTTCVPEIVDEKDIEGIGKFVKGAKKYYLQQFRPAVTFDEKFHNIKPYGRKELEKFQSILSKYVEDAGIRGI